jgi:hypothetical protein
MLACRRYMRMSFLSASVLLFLDLLCMSFPFQKQTFKKRLTEEVSAIRQTQLHMYSKQMDKQDFPNLFVSKHHVKMELVRNNTQLNFAITNSKISSIHNV